MRLAPDRFLESGDTVDIEMRDAKGRDLFGRIAQRVVAPEAT